MKRFIHLLPLTVLVILFQSNGFSIQSKQQSPVERIRAAMQLTALGQSNITAAHSAVYLWNYIIEQGDLSSQPTPILILGNTLYASSLSHIGQDLDAVDIYDHTLSMADDCVEDEILIDVRIGRGEALQRLMRYEEARSEFNAVVGLGRAMQLMGPKISHKISKCACSAVLCSLRQGDRNAAVFSLSKLFDGVRDLSVMDSTLVGLYGTLLWELHQSKGTKKIMDLQTTFEPIQMLYYAASSSSASPIYQWFYAIASKSKCKMFGRNVKDMGEESLLRIASINQSPFDNPALKTLDNKVLLHDLLHQSKRREAKWPNGFVLPRDQGKFEEYISANPDGEWILKEGAGYGSHGNRIVNGVEGLEFSKECVNMDPEHLVLCQKLIEPSILFHNRKFSIRVYVVYFHQAGENGEDAVYVLNQGLAKLAESVYEKGQNSDEMYMTNSGRKEGDGMLQYDLQSLRDFMDSKHCVGTFDGIWHSVCRSVLEVMKVFCESQRNDALSHPPPFLSTVPKIMGFDYIIDAALQPWLLEVNRFPGLEARGACDYNVKREVILDAWTLASNLSGIDNGLASRISTNHVQLNMYNK